MLLYTSGQMVFNSSEYCSALTKLIPSKLTLSSVSQAWLCAAVSIEWPKHIRWGRCTYQMITWVGFHIGYSSKLSFLWRCFWAHTGIQSTFLVLSTTIIITHPHFHPTLNHLPVHTIGHPCFSRKNIMLSSICCKCLCIFVPYTVKILLKRIGYLSRLVSYLFWGGIGAENLEMEKCLILNIWLSGQSEDDFPHTIELT